MTELAVENLHLRYGDNPILQGVALTLNRGEVVSLLGPSGSGKCSRASTSFSARSMATQRGRQRPGESGSRTGGRS